MKLILLQRHYKPDGWLGLMCGAKLYINFDGKFEFKDAFDMLKREILKHLDVIEDEVDGPKGMAK